MDGTTNGTKFRTYVADVLVPALKLGNTVVMDNQSAHKVKGVRPLIETADACLLYLPPYSPDFNPIDNVFAKLKALLSGHRQRKPSRTCMPPSDRPSRASPRTSVGTASPQQATTRMTLPDREQF